MPRVSLDRCRYTKPDGSRCKATPRPGRPYCTFHDPGLAHERAEGRRKGGKERSRPAATLPPDHSGRWWEVICGLAEPADLSLEEQEMLRALEGSVDPAAPGPVEVQLA